MKRHNVPWSAMTPAQRTAVIVAGLIELTLVALVQADLARRSPESLRFPKAAWRLAAFIQPVGPIAYLLVERLNVLPRRAAA